MKYLSLFAAATLGALTLATTGLAADDVSREDKEFLKNASELGITEVELGKLAVAKATDPELKALGARLVADCSASNEELVALALKKGVELNLEPTATQKQMLAAFETKTGAEFDKELMEHVRKDHDKGLRLFADAAADTKDADIKAFALQNVSIMKEHYKMAGGTVSVE
jgi:putative membrane protein